MTRKRTRRQDRGNLKRVFTRIPLETYVSLNNIAYERDTTMASVMSDALIFNEKALPGILDTLDRLRQQIGELLNENRRRKRTLATSTSDKPKLVN